MQAKVKAKASFTSGGARRASFDADNQGTKVQEVATALTKCSKLTSTDAKGAKTALELTGLSFPNLGDQTLAIRVTGKSEGFTIVADLVTIAIGRNFVTFTAAGVQPMPGADLEKIARAGVAKVGQAAKS